MGRPKSRHPEAKQINAWLSPAGFRTLDTWKALRGYRDRTQTLEAILEAVARRIEKGNWLSGGGPAITTERPRIVTRGSAAPREERDDLAEDTGPDYVPRTAGGIEIEPDCPEMAALED